MSTVKVANADRMIIAVVPGGKGIDATFADGSQGTVPFKDIPEVGNHSNLKSVELPNPYEVILTTPQNEQVELPWDFVRHYCDRTYRPKMELIAAEGRQVLGTRVRAFREDAGLTQEALAQAAGIGRVTLVRLENGKHVPKLGTLRAIAKILERPVEDLLTGHEEPRHTE
jgi:DNA-binding XRE family transcriptional regulator